MSTNARTLSDKIQTVLRFYGEADAIQENYDFVHCTKYWTSKDANLTLRQPALESLLCKVIWYVGSIYPVCYVIRMHQYMRSAWVINAVLMIKRMLRYRHATNSVGKGVG